MAMDDPKLVLKIPIGWKKAYDKMDQNFLDPMSEFLTGVWGDLSGAGRNAYRNTVEAYKSAKDILNKPAVIIKYKK